MAGPGGVIEDAAHQVQALGGQHHCFGPPQVVNVEVVDLGVVREPRGEERPDFGIDRLTVGGLSPSGAQQHGRHAMRRSQRRRPAPCAVRKRFDEGRQRLLKGGRALESGNGMNRTSE